MRLGPITIHRYRKNAAGLEVYPWQALTTDRLTPEVRALVAKMARSEVKGVLEDAVQDVKVELHNHVEALLNIAWPAPMPKSICGDPECSVCGTGEADK